MVENRKVKLTKLVLQEALIDLLQEKSIENISIRELTDFADINRSTFYSHYATIYDLLDSITDTYMEKIEYPSKQHDLLIKDQIQLLEYMKLHQKVYLALIKTGKFLEYLTHKSIAIFDSDQLSYRMLKKEYKAAYEAMVHYACSGTTEILHLFLEDKLDLTTSQVAILLYQAQEAIYQALLRYQKLK